MTLSITFRTDDFTRWGSGIGADLIPSQVDINFWTLKGAVEQLQADLPAASATISYFAVSGDQFYVHMSDLSVLGPYQLPMIKWNFRGVWLPSTSYAVNDVVRYRASIYLVIFAHTSAGSFDPNANNGMGDNYYDLLMTVNNFSATIVVPDGTMIPNSSSVGFYHRCTESLGCVVTIANDADLTPPLEIDDEVHFRQSAAGQVTFVAGAGVTLNGITGFVLGTAARGAVVTVKKIAANTYDVFGLLASV